MVTCLAAIHLYTFSFARILYITISCSSPGWQGDSFKPQERIPITSINPFVVRTSSSLQRTCACQPPFLWLHLKGFIHPFLLVGFVGNSPNHAAICSATYYGVLRWNHHSETTMLLHTSNWLSQWVSAGWVYFSWLFSLRCFANLFGV